MTRALPLARRKFYPPNSHPLLGNGARSKKRQKTTLLSRSAPPRSRVPRPSQSVSFVAVPPRSLHHRLKGRLRTPRSTQHRVLARSGYSISRPGDPVPTLCGIAVYGSCRLSRCSYRQQSTRSRRANQRGYFFSLTLSLAGAYTLQAVVPFARRALAEAAPRLHALLGGQPPIGEDAHQCGDNARLVRALRGGRTRGGWYLLPPAHVRRRARHLAAHARHVSVRDLSEGTS